MISLHSFYVFNSSYGPKEGEEIKKVLYYYPPTADENTKCKDVGLAEAMAKFVETFTDEPCHAIHTQKQRHLYYQPEPEFWMIMKLNVPHTTKQKHDVVLEEYHDEDIHDTVYGTVLRQAYDMFKLFMGTFADILTKSQGDVKGLKQRLEHFYSRYLITVRLSQCDILDVYNGISWLPLDKRMYLRVQCLMNRLEAKYPQIAYTAFLCSDYLVWTGVPQQDMRVIYQYLITSLFRSHLEQEMTSDGGKRSFSGNNFGQFITGIPLKAEDTTPSRIPRVYINVDGSLQEFHLLVYRALSVTVCALIKGANVITPTFSKKFDADLGPTLTELASELVQKYPQKSASGGDLTIKYIYFNHMNLATKTTVHVDTRKTRLVSVPVDILSTIADMNSDLKNINHDCECLVRTAGEYWVVCKKSDSRELYVVICDRNANLTDINGSQVCYTVFISDDFECLGRTVREYWVFCRKPDSRELYLVICDRTANLTDNKGGPILQTCFVAGESRKLGGETPATKPPQPVIKEVRRTKHSYEEIVLDEDESKDILGTDGDSIKEVVTVPQTALEPILKMVSTVDDNKQIPRPTPSTSAQPSDSKRWSISSEEYELHQAMVGKFILPQNNNTTTKRQWSIPDTDSEDDFSKKQRSWAETKVNGLLNINTEKKSPAKKFNLPSDSDEEDPYSMAKSPSLSIKSAEPPLPPPVSTIPRTYKAMKASLSEDQASLPEVSQEGRKKLTVNALVDIRKRSIVSNSDTDPYDEIDCGTEEQKGEKEGQSQPRYKFTLSKSKTRLNPLQGSLDTTYAEIPKKSQWNFPSSSDEDEEVEQRRHKKSGMGKPKIARQDSNTSEEEERPVLPPKLWELSSHTFEQNQPNNDHGDIKAIEDSEIQRGNYTDDVTIEYSALKRSDLGRKGSLLDLYDEVVEGNSNSCGEDNNDMADTLSVQSENSSKTIPDYEQSSTCVDMDQLSLDSSGKRPKRIVETHETHEIVPSDNNEDDIVERIIETQTITEKLDDNRAFNDYSGEDYLKCIEDDDEFVSHIFTLGRTLEKGAKKKKSKDFAFVENPFSAPDPVIETMPLEKKTVKQKITTLVKKKKSKDDENVYAEVKPSGSHEGAYNKEEFDDDEEVDNYNHTNDLQRPAWDAYNGMGGANGEPSHGNRVSNMSNDSSGLVYETFDDQPEHFAKLSAVEKKKEPKTEKKSLFKGIKKFLKKKDKTQEGDKAGALVLEDDYQEFVP